MTEVTLQTNACGHAQPWIASCSVYCSKSVYLQLDEKALHKQVLDGLKGASTQIVLTAAL